MIEGPAYAELLDPAESRFPAAWRSLLPAQLEAVFEGGRHGRWSEWRTLLGRLPAAPASHCVFNEDVVTIGSFEGVDERDRRSIESLLRQLHPWRKGPFCVYGIEIDAEWRSDRKWRRLGRGIAPLEDRVVLDIGCGNGYYAWRMLGQGASFVIGIDPSLAHVVQFLAIKHFAGDRPVHVLPLGIEAVPRDLGFFDTVFSMGVLYHRRSPIDHLLEVKGCLRGGGELVLETLVTDGERGYALMPEDRYAQMRNVWFIPSILTLESWLKRCGYRHIRLIDVSETTVDEQRATAWMRFHSLADFLDPGQPNRTVEGLPAPRRAIFLAEAP